MGSEDAEIHDFFHCALLHLEALHEGDHGRWVVAGGDQKLNSAVVGALFGFDAPTVGERGSDKAARHESGIGAGEDRSENERDLHRAHLGLLFLHVGQVALGGVADFVGEDSGEFVIALGELHETVVDIDVATGKAEGVDVFAVDDLKSVLQHDLALFAPEGFETRLAVGDKGELCAEFFDSLLRCRIFGWLVLFVVVLGGFFADAPIVIEFALEGLDFLEFFGVDLLRVLTFASEKCQRTCHIERGSKHHLSSLDVLFQV